MGPLIFLVNGVFILGLLVLTYWYGRSTRRLLRRAQGQVADLESQAMAKIAELQASYARILREIDERQQAEARLQESETRFAAFMQNVPGAAVILDAADTILYANETWGDIFGSTPGEAPGEWGESPRREAELNRQVREGRQSLQHLETLEQDGQTRYWLVTRFPIPPADGGTPLVGAIGMDITARRVAEEALRESEAKLRLLAAQLLRAQENERKRLAAELHDELGHRLLTLKLRLEALEAELSPQQEAMKEDIHEMLRDIAETIAEVRRLYLDLSPGDLEDLGLTTALTALIDDFRGLKKDISWTVDLEDLDGLFPLPVQTAIYRVVQEALTNIGKHAAPRRVSLTATREDGRVVFEIQDDGHGFDQHLTSRTRGTLGLLAMEERVRMLGGDFHLWSRPGHGTRISFTIPQEGEHG
jgi:PAS domain S-box-containing protein